MRSRELDDSQSNNFGTTVVSEHNTIYDAAGTILGHFRFGVAWSKNPRERLGEYDDKFVYDGDGNVIAEYSEGLVHNVIGEQIGRFENQSLIVNEEIVGRCIGVDGASAAAIALIFSRCAIKDDGLCRS